MLSYGVPLDITEMSAQQEVVSLLLCTQLSAYTTVHHRRACAQVEADFRKYNARQASHETFHLQ